MGEENVCCERVRNMLVMEVQRSFVEEKRVEIFVRRVRKLEFYRARSNRKCEKLTKL